MKKIKFIDITRAFAIIFIVFGHCIVHCSHLSILYKFLNSFHVPLFFIISGFLFKIRNDDTFVKFFSRKFIRLMVPYFIWAFVFLIPYFVFGNSVASHLNQKSSFNLLEQIGIIFYGVGYDTFLKQNSALWFLPALFVTELIYYIIFKYIHKSKDDINYLFLASSFVFAFLFNKYFNIILPWGLNSFVIFAPIFYLSYIFRNNNIFSENKIFKFNYFVIFLFIGIVSCFLNSEVSCKNYEYGNIILFYLSSLFLSISVIYICYKISKNNFLEYIGSSSMSILIFHKLLIVIFQSKMGFISNMYLNSNMFLELFISFLVTIIAIVFSLILNKLFDRYPFLLGR